MESQGTFIQGAVKSLKTMVIGGSQVVEGVHEAVLTQVSALAPVPASVPSLTRLVYQSIREITSSVGSGAEAILKLGQVTANPFQQRRLTSWQLHLLSAFNGAFGDHFHRDGHPWAIPMTLLYQGKPLDVTAPDFSKLLKNPSPHIVIFLHGLGMNELGWQKPGGESYGQQLETEAGCTVFWLRYNTGRHIYENGQLLAEKLEALVEAWPTPVQSITLVGHSMGGLLARSTSYYGHQFQYRWTRYLRGICCLGSPHQGAHLENIGNWLSHLLAMTSYSSPLANIGRSRSAGIKDLRHGSLLEEDWHGRDRDAVERFVPHPIPLIDDVGYLLVASTMSHSTEGALAKLLGDGLVTPGSALRPRIGNCDEQPGQVTRTLLQGVGHIELLNRQEVYDSLRSWYCSQVLGMPEQADVLP